MKRTFKQPVLNPLQRKGLAFFFAIIILSLPFGKGWGWASFAQDSVAVQQPAPAVVKPKNFSLGLEGGYSYLLGNLTGIRYGDVKSGYASNSGFNAGINGAYWLNKHVGIGGLLSFSSFYPSQIGLDSLAAGYQHSYNGDSAMAQSSTKYSFYNLLLGPHFSFPFKKDRRVAIDARFLGGASYVRVPEFDVSVINIGVPHPFAQNIAQSISWAMQAGASIKFVSLNGIGVRLAADAFYTDPSFNITNSNMPAYVRQLSNYHQPILIFNFSFGLSYTFGK